jgi:hypothetical protein
MEEYIEKVSGKTAEVLNQAKSFPRRIRRQMFPKIRQGRIEKHGT